jgi:hypothetical protein
MRSSTGSKGSGRLNVFNVIYRRHRETAVKRGEGFMPYAQSRQLEEARAEATEVLQIDPGFTIEQYKRLQAPRGCRAPC